MRSNYTSVGSGRRGGSWEKSWGCHRDGQHAGWVHVFLVVVGMTSTCTQPRPHSRMRANLR
ncbi:hypothetical protein GE21DRAFT_1263730 [Neurospora crassa]|nr:hypothetical protein GE21DRAFT_1263730 [Neurospora crassa]